MFSKLTAKNLMDCFTSKLQNTQTYNEDSNILNIKECYKNLDVNFSACDQECLNESFSAPNQNIESSSYDAANLVSFYNSVAAENVELCYYNCSN